MTPIDAAYLVLFLLIAYGTAIIGAPLVTHARDWFAKQKKPPGYPPPIVFGLVWTILYGLIGVAGWLAYRLPENETRTQLLWLWSIGMVLNFLWTPFYFAWHRTTLAMVTILGLLGTIVWFIVLIYPLDTVAAWLFIIYGTWIAYASWLNIALHWLNPIEDD